MRKSKNKDVNIVCQNDQLKLILDVLGHQDQKSLSFVNNEAAMNHHSSLVSEDIPNSLRKMFPKTSKGLLDLLEGMLTYNPNYRWTTTKCLKLKIFDQIRDTNCEEPAESKIHLPLFDEGMYDYEKNISSLSIEEMKKVLLKEVRQVKMSLKK